MYWDYILSVAGVAGFILAGKKVWWAWYINIAAQFIWLAYALVTEQYGFLIGTVIYFAVFVKNAYEWTMDHRAVVAAEKATVDRLHSIRDALDSIKAKTITQEQARYLHKRIEDSHDT